MPITKNRVTRNGSEPRSEFICCQQFNFRLRDVDGFLFEDSEELKPAQTHVFFKHYTVSVTDDEKVLYSYLSKNLNCLPVE
jgi:hypothetical protein